MCRIALKTAALARLKPTWNYKHGSPCSKIRLKRSLVISCAVERLRNLDIDSGDPEKKCMALRKLHTETISLTMQAEAELGKPVDLRWHLNHGEETQVKMVWASIKINRACKKILQGTVQWGRGRKEQKKQWENNIFECTGLRCCDTLREDENRIKWR